MAAKNSGRTLTFEQLGGITGVPPEFIAAMELREEVTSVPNDVEPQALSDRVFFSRVETNRTDERQLHTYFKKAGNITLSAVNTNAEGQPVQVTRTLFPTGTTPAAPSATESVAVQDLGNGWSIQESSVEGTYVDGVFTPGVFSGAKYEKRVPDVVPERFRVAVPTVATDLTSAGTAAMPTLASGELDRTEEQVTAFKKRVHVESRTSVSLPVSLVGKDTDNDRESVTVTETLKAAGSDATPSATQQVQVQNLGDGTVLQTVRSVPEVFASTEHTVEMSDVVPEAFRALVPTSTDASTAAGTATTPTLSTGDLRATSQQVDKYKVRTTREHRDLTALPAVLVGKETDRDKETVTVTQTLQAEADATASASATQDVEVQNLGAGLVVETVKAVPEVFAGTVHSKQVPDATPERFRVAIPTVTDESTSAGTAATPTLGAGDLARSETQVDKFKKRTVRTYRSLADLPVSLVGADTNGEKQDVTVTETLREAGDNTPVDATHDVTVQNLGDGTVLETVREVSSVFDAAEYETSRPDPRPEKFRVAVPEVTEKHVVEGDAGAPTLATGDLAASERQVTEFTKETSVTSRADGSAPTLTGHRFTQDGQMGTLVETLVADGTVPSVSALTLEARVETVGDGTSVQSVLTVPSVFAASTFSKEILDLTPPEFRAAIPTTQVATTTAGTATAPSLGTGELKKTTEQVTAQRVRTTTEARDAASLPVTLTNLSTNNVKQVQTVVITLEADDTTPATPDATHDVEVKVLGDGTQVETVTSVPDVFSATVLATQIPDVVPEKFRAAVPTITTEVTSAGDAEAPTLTPGDLARKQEQVTEFTKRETVTSRDVTSLPVTITGKETDANREVVSVAQTLLDDSTTPAVPTALQTVEFEKLGNGTAVQTVKSVPEVFSGVAYSIERPDNTPDIFRALVSATTTATTTAGSAAAPSLTSGDLRATSTQVDKYTKRNEVVHRDPTELPATVVDKETTSDLQVATVTQTLQTAGTSTATPDATTTVEVKTLGDGNEVEVVRTIPDVFARSEYAKVRPVVTPQDFRALIPTVETATTAAGTAGAPSLTTGDVSVRDTQVNEFTHRVEHQTQAAPSLPVSITNKGTDEHGLVQTVVRTLQVDATAITAPTATSTVVAERLGDGTTLQVVTTVPSVFDPAVYRAQIPDVVPEAFRVALPTVTTEHVTTGTAAAPTLTTGQLSATSRQVNTYIKSTEIVSRDAVTLPVSLVGADTNREKQAVVVTQTLREAGDDTAPSATVDVQVQNLGDGTVLETTREVDSVFAATTYSTQRPDLLPQEFRGIIPLTQTATTSAGTAGAPTLGTGDLSASSEQVTEFTKRDSVSHRDPLSLPATLTDSQVQRDGQVASVVKTVAVGAQTVTPSATVIEGSVQNLGDGTTLKTTVTIPGVLPLTANTIRQQDVVPQRHKIDLTSTTTSYEEASTSDTPVALGNSGLGVTESASQRIDKFKRRVSTTTLGGNFNNTTDYEVTRELGAGANVATITELIVDNGDDPRPDTGFGVLSSSTTYLSDQNSLTRTSRVDGFPLREDGYRIGSIASTYPGKYAYSNSVGEEEYTLQTILIGTDPVIPSGHSLLESTPLDQYHKEVKIGTRGGTNGIGTLSGTELGRYGTVTHSWVLDATTPVTGQTTISSQLNPAGDGRTEVESRVSEDSVTPTARERADWSSIPARFLLAFIQTTVDTPVAPGTAADTGAGILRSVVEPTDNPDRSILRTTSLSGVSTLADLPTLTGTEPGRDAAGDWVTETEKVVATGTSLPSLGFKDLSFKDQPIGNGLLLRTQRTLTPTTFPVLKDDDVFDPRYNVRIREEQQIVVASESTSSPPSAPSGGIAVTYKSLDKYRSIKITKTLIVPGAIPDEYGKAGWHRPALLTSITPVSTNLNHPKYFIVQENARSYLAATRTVISIAAGLSADTLDAPIIGTNIDYHGYLINLHLDDVLYDGGILIVDDGDSTLIDATTPTRTDYLALVGTEVIISSDVQPYHFGLDIRRTVYLTLQ